MYPGFGQNFDAQTRRSFPPQADDQYPELPTLPSSSTAAYYPATSSHPQLSFSNQPMYQEPFGTFLPPPVTAADQSHRDYRLATFNANHLPPSSFSSQPPFGPPMSFPDPILRPDFFDSSTPQYRSPSQDVPPYWDSAVLSNIPFDTYYNSVAQDQPQDFLSIDRLSTMPPGGDDIPPLGDPLPVLLPPNEPRPQPVGRSVPDSLPIRQSGSRSRPLQFHPYNRSSQLKLRGVAINNDIPDGGKPLQPKPSRIGPSLYDEDNSTHQTIFNNTTDTLIRSALNNNPFLFEQERKQQALDALISSASEFEKDHGKQWATDNLGEFYRSTTPPSASIMSSCKKVARGLVQHGYGLRPSVWLRTSEIQHQVQMVENLTASFPPEFIFEKDDSDKRWAFENRVVLDVVLNTITDLGYSSYLTDLKSITCTACAAVLCALKERSSGRFARIEFVVSQYKEEYESFMNYIETVILPDPELSARWEEFTVLVFDTLNTICS
ncbi:hypothetical protein DEU56DRAFT_915905 [Suillus clintonianus]|uniref:uncharacterized protein n=1 Tax=Suillus clintonianus TaxID=1904413 RepID=UPI001B8702E0|nr:uncharacterized protein DEU56DRAFT_915905 [Suillus clintonianus]KAG2126959.1 hypothetical protein DEU56DRAFT_915905 [Suillus clintonianus]